MPELTLIHIPQLTLKVTWIFVYLLHSTLHGRANERKKKEKKKSLSKQENEKYPGQVDPRNASN